MAFITAETTYWHKIAEQYSQNIYHGRPTGGLKTAYLSNAAKGKVFYPRVLAARAAGYPSANLADILYYEKVTNPAYIEEQKRLEEARQLAIRIENERLALIAKNDKVALDLFDVLNAKRIKIQQDEIIRINQVIETQRLAEIKAEEFRLELIKAQETKAAQQELEIQELAATKEFDRVNKTIPLIASVLPVSIIGLLLLYSRMGRK